MQNSLVFRDGCLEVVWNVRLVCIESIRLVNLLVINVDFNIWNYWMQYVVYVVNSSYFFFVVCSCFSENNRLIFVLFFLFLTLVCNVMTSVDKFELQCQKRLSQINVIVPIRLAFKLYAIFIKWGGQLNFLFMQGQLFMLFILDCSVDFVWMILLSLPLRNCFFRVCLPHTLCSRLERFSTSNNLCNLWCSKLQHVSTYAFCRWDDIFTQKGNCSSRSILCKSPKSPSFLSSNHSIVWNFYLSWSNHLVLSYALEMIVGHISKHQNKPIDPDRYKGYFLTRCVSQINVYTMKKFFEQGSKL